MVMRIPVGLAALAAVAAVAAALVTLSGPAAGHSESAHLEQDAVQSPPPAGAGSAAGAGGKHAVMSDEAKAQADAAARAATGATTDPAAPMPHPTKAKKRAAPRFYECIEEKRARAAKNCGGRCDIVWIGDSISEDMTGDKCYWGQKGDTGGPWSNFSLRDRTVVVAGAMDQTQHTLYTLREVLPSLRRPKIFFVLIGTNNIGSSLMTPAQTARGVRAVVEAIRWTFPGIKVLLHTQLPRFDEEPKHKGVLQSRLDVLDSQLAEYARAEAPGVEMVNCSGAFPRGHALGDLMPDYLHPTTEGYRRWLQCLRPVLEGAVNAAA